VIRVRPYVDDDKEFLRTFVRELWSDRPAEVFDNRWWWRHSTSPLIVAADEQTNRIVGMCAYIPFRLRAGGTDQRAAWFVDFFVAPDQQGKGLGKLLTCEVLNQFPVTASLSQSDAAWAVFRKLQWHARSYAKLYLHVAPALWHGSAKWRRGSKITVSSQLYTSALSPDIAARIDDLWRSVRGLYDAIAVRDSTSLNDRYATFEQRRYRLLLAYRDDQLIGYMISRVLAKNSLQSFRRSFGLVVDYLILNEDPDVFRALLGNAAKASVAEGARGMMCMSTSNAIGRVLAGTGYLHSGTPLIGRKLGKLDVAFTSYGLERASSNWFLTPGDCDLDLSWGETPTSGTRASNS
jgi:GNAT superfamily N-acetyltransferase